MRHVTEYFSTLHYRVLFFTLLFLVFFAASVGDTVSEALVLSVYSAEVVSHLFFVNALILFVLSFLALSIIDNYNRGKIFILFLVTYAVSLFLLRLFHFLGEWVYLVLYVLSYTGKIMMFLLAWTLANDVADSRSGAKHFPFIAAGGTLGAIVGTFSIPVLVKTYTPLQLLWVWILLLFTAALLVKAMVYSLGHHFSRRRFNRQVSLHFSVLGRNIRDLMRQPLLNTMATAYFFIFIIIFCQQYLFYDVVRSEYEDALSISGFLGYFKGGFLLITFLLQAFVAGRLTRYIGWIRVLTVLPFVFFLSFAAMWYFDMHGLDLYIHTVIAAMGLRIAVFDSFFSPNYQNIFSIFPEDLRGRGKLTIDGVFKPLAMAVSAGLIVLISSQTQMLVILLFLSLIALGITLRLRRHYLFTALGYLHRTSSEEVPQRISQSLSYEKGLELLDTVIEEQPRELKFCAVDILVELDNDRAIARLIHWYPLVDTYVQAYIVSALGKAKNRNVLPFVRYLLRAETDPRVVANVLIALWSMQEEEETVYAAFLSHAVPRVRGNAIYILFYLGFSQKYSLEARLEEMLFIDAEGEEKSALWVLAHIPITNRLTQALKQYWYTRTVRVLRSFSYWKSFVAAVVRSRDYALLFELVDMYQAVSEQKQRELVSQVAWLIHRDGEADIVAHMGEFRSSYTTDFVLRALAHSRVHVGESMVKRLERFAEQEYEKFLVSRQALHYLRSFLHNSGRVDPYLEYYIQVIEQEEQSLHFNNLLECVAIVDASNAVNTILDKIHIYSRTIYSRVVDIIDTASSKRINKLIVTLMEGGGHCPREFHSLDEVFEIYLLSGLPVVRESTLYLINQQSE
ncbi:MFS transporter [Chitinivibrio alkaliphilus]|uniref:Major facilitator superfamily n=1 Tax=Chitinivibrio alkaliphilus ACht1 TaxID=1313304 RepID=U7D650_9BACT|nr:MFS transporter [Chitinivibrio alkaliphilus]ERP31994.1 major facilitator superfamily [Chitinivibrio alkaliphilus ACht1]